MVKNVPVSGIQSVLTVVVECRVSACLTEQVVVTPAWKRTAVTRTCGDLMNVGILCLNCGFDGRVEISDDCVDDNYDIDCRIYCPDCGELVYDPNGRE